jgi:glycosyltransferase involved in cell wall biosynthesis
MIQVTFFQRRRFPNGNYSVEFIFDDVRYRLKTLIDAKIAISKFHSQGIFNRVYNIIEAPFKQGEINHITGDIHFISFLLQKKKTILTILDCGFMKDKSGWRKMILQYFWLFMPIKRVKVITAISEYTKKDILQYVKCDPDRIRVIPVAISDRFKYYPKEFNKNKPVLLQIGSAPNKNLIRIIEAVKGVNIRLVTIGLLDQKVKALLTDYNIDFENFYNLKDNEIHKKYLECDILLFPSTFEGFGMPILEAQSIGRPVITSDVSSMPEVAGGAALLVDPFSVNSIRSALKKVIEDDAFRDSLIIKGLKNVKRYNADKIANMYFKLYEEILHGK